MPLRIIIEPIVEGAVYVVAEIVAEIVEQFFGETVLSRVLPSEKKPYSDAYGKSFFCLRCPGMAKLKKTKRRWFLYRCQDCGEEWGVLRAQPWVRRERKNRERLGRGAS